MAASAEHDRLAEMAAEVVAELLDHEPLFHRREHVASRADFERETVEDYWEVGASGQRYDRERIWEVLAARFAASEVDDHVAEAWRLTDVEVRAVAPDVYLLTYVLHQPDDRTSRRLTVWRGRPGGTWVALYHQGTLVTS